MTATEAPARRRDWLDYVVTAMAVAMSLYHLNIAWTGGYESLFQRSSSYLFGLVLIFLVFSGPGWRRWAGIALAILAGGLMYYTVDQSWTFVRRMVYVERLSALNIAIGTTIILLTLEAARRTINNALPIIALTFLVYTLTGPYFPWEFAHKGASFTHMIELQYTTNDGLWSTPLNVFSVYIFLFILFGAFLDRMGAADFYVQLSFALTGRRRGGPAKAAIFASAMTGTITGSTNANVATTGTFTIPMMKNAGFKPEVAAGIETAASTGGQIMPPVMGAAAFLIVEYTGISYWDIVKVSIVPALLYFFSVYTMVHLEARRGGLQGLPRDQVPRLGPIMKEGGFFLIPPILILAMIMDGWDVPHAGLAGIASVALLAAIKAVIVLALKARREPVGLGEFAALAWRGVTNVIGAMDKGARQSLPICAAVATVGIIIGALFQTGLGVKFSSIVISLSHGSLLLGVMLVGIASFVLGMGLPTSAAYIVLSVMAVPALLALGEPYGLSLLAAHLIVFWFSLDSCFTPPVCVPAYTAAGIADANPSKAAWAAFRTAKGMYVIPLMFAFTPLLLIDQPLAMAETCIAALFGFVALGAVMVGYLVGPLSMTDRLLLLAAGVCLFWPMMAAHAAGAVLLAGGVALQYARWGKAEPEPGVPR